MSEENCPYCKHPKSWHSPLGCQFHGCNCHQTSYLFQSEKIEELQAERDMLAKKLEVAMKALHRLSSYNCGFIANNIIATALAKIEKIEREHENVE